MISPSQDADIRTAHHLAREWRTREKFIHGGHKETFGPFDAADYLITFESVAAYLEAVIEEGDDDPP